MTIFVLPNKRLFFPRRLELQMAGNVAENRSPLNGVTQTAENPGDPWVLRADYGNNYTEGERDEQRAFWNRLRGKAHRLRMWQVMRPIPRGTMRGAPTLAASAVEGANAVTIATTAGATLLYGDFIGITLNNGFIQLVETSEASTSGSTITASITPPLRRAAAAGAAVVWLRPTADFILGGAPFIPHEPKVSSGFSVEAVEDVQ